jgi:hypothetical protein
VKNPAGPVSIGGTHTLTLGNGGVDLSTATQNLTATAPLVLSAAQNWNVASVRTLSMAEYQAHSRSPSAPAREPSPLGAAIGRWCSHHRRRGTLKTSAPACWPAEPAHVNRAVNGTLDLHGTTQSVNSLTGTGIVDNTAAGCRHLTVGQS